MYWEPEQKLTIPCRLSIKESLHKYRSLVFFFFCWSISIAHSIPTVMLVFINWKVLIFTIWQKKKKKKDAIAIVIAASICSCVLHVFLCEHMLFGFCKNLFEKDCLITKVNFLDQRGGFHGKTKEDQNSCRAIKPKRTYGAWNVCQVCIKEKRNEQKEK